MWAVTSRPPCRMWRTKAETTTEYALRDHSRGLPCERWRGGGGSGGTGNEAAGADSHPWGNRVFRADFVQSVPDGNVRGTRRGPRVSHRERAFSGASTWQGAG